MLSLLLLAEAVHEQCESFCDTYIAGTCDAVVVAVSPAAAVDDASVLALDHTVCVKHRRSITNMDVLTPTRLSSNPKTVLTHLYTQGSTSQEG